MQQLASADTEIYFGGLLLMDHYDHLRVKYLCEALNFKFHLDYPWGVPLAPWPFYPLKILGGGGGGGSQGRWQFNVSDHQSMIYFWKTLEASYYPMLNLGKLGKTWLKLARFGSSWLNLAKVGQAWLQLASVVVELGQIIRKWGWPAPGISTS